MSGGPPDSLDKRDPGHRTTAPSLNKTVPDAGDGAIAPMRARAACLVVIKGPLFGHKFDLEQELIVGRDPQAGVFLDDGLVSRSHAKISPDGAGVRIFDLCSTNGTFVNDSAVTSKYLDDGDKIAIGNTLFKFISRDNIEAVYHEHLYSMTHFDALTGVHNRPTFDSSISSSIAKAARVAEPLALMLLDIDHFKRCNDTYGHRAGDYVLKQVGTVLGDNLRDGDFVARYGGEEFALIIRRLSPPGPARFAEHLRGVIQAQRFEFEGHHIPVTISAGVAYWDPAMQSPAQLIELADQRLYRAKHAGRNQIVAE
ncbi:diguanylate cyclase [Pseudenhygromyxa sp. WMMC2535]|uniref:GGDEF domain-containing protein n=1 Tax=Pseudenhygromyxa sp. WMMC2535 TaxID=2712867 RepID=UPI00155461B6|nr:GGDEF domain-containing protein [Pseudenhygromyxa sp. WMMC2535]NVB41855.1 diguanylate cyclase [Pseudenhygromyxa sp. WMMC2535]